jgi:hypothetical protein
MILLFQAVIPPNAARVIVFFARAIGIRLAE